MEIKTVIDFVDRLYNNDYDNVILKFPNDSRILGELPLKFAKSLPANKITSISWKKENHDMKLVLVMEAGKYDLNTYTPYGKPLPGEFAF